MRKRLFVIRKTGHLFEGGATTPAALLMVSTIGRVYCTLPILHLSTFQEQNYMRREVTKRTSRLSYSLDNASFPS
jgi:hypothetical protein